MYYGVEQSTDMRNKQTQIKKFTSKRSLEKWMQNSGNFTHSDPVAARNYHHTYRYGYELIGRVNKKDPIFKDKGSSTYPRTNNDNLALYLYSYGKEFK